MRDVSNSEDILDSRDVESRIEELQDEQDSLVDEYTEAKEEAEEDEAEALTERLTNAINALSSFWDLNPEEIDGAVEALANPADGFNGDEELAALKAFRDELEPYCPDWQHGTTLIRDSYFKEYAMDFAEDIGAINGEAGWPNDCIDWDKAASELQMDYTSGEFDGVTYWAR